MCWKCDNPGGTTEEYLAELRQTMLETGWAVQYVESDRMPFAYTVGLTRYGLPELLVTGVTPRRAAQMLNTLGRRAVKGERPSPGMRIALPAGALVEMVEVDHPDVYLIFAGAIFGDEVTALQVVWVDSRGHWPWSPSFNNGRGIQPVLGARAAPGAAEAP
ncbi:DUF4262 domain-containing protein [Mycobacterium sp. E796]|uniref:DUF4262 domain-containing protein n=1 Tax=Mycobacterium sp. E796 TaxID=1834151 RepID=UPI0008004506|nr:DUF4262 domain-containing protein [Mycobacterium sp. E796]OBI42897.1 hypothetical protein A5706_06180 [Mycobacterium sp. E796]